MPDEFKLPKGAKGPFAEANVSLGITLNLGNYESIRIDVGARVPCRPEDMDDTYEKTLAWAESRIDHKVKEVRAESVRVNQNRRRRH